MQHLVKILGFALLFTTTAQAVTDFTNAPSGAHYARGAGEPTCEITGTTVSCTGTAIQGVGNTNAVVNLEVTATFEGVCRNPGNENVVDPFTESDMDTTTAELTPSRNGRLSVPAQSATAETPEEFEANFQCPNDNWTPVVTETVVSFEYTVTFVGFDAPVISITG